MSIGTYKKFLSTLAATIGVALVPVFADDVITVAEGINVGIVGFGAVTVLGATNLPEGVWRLAKGWFAAGSAALVAVNTFYADGLGINGSEWLQVGIAAAGAVGVFGLSNTGSARNGASTAATGIPGRLTA